jgi:hypothetical protein
MEEKKANEFCTVMVNVRQVFKNKIDQRHACMQNSTAAYVAAGTGGGRHAHAHTRGTRIHTSLV